MNRLALILSAVTILAVVGCSDPPEEEVTVVPTVEVERSLPEPEPTEVPTATAIPLPSLIPTSTPAPTATPEPTPTSTPEPTPSPCYIEGKDLEVVKIQVRNMAVAYLQENVQEITDGIATAVLEQHPDLEIALPDLSVRLLDEMTMQLVAVEDDLPHAVLVSTILTSTAGVIAVEVPVYVLLFFGDCQMAYLFDPESVVVTIVN